MTFGFMLGAALVMAAAVTLLATIFDVNADRQMRDLVAKATKSVEADMKSPDWQTKLAQLAATPELAERGVALAIIERRTRDRLWVSRQDFPARGDRTNHEFRIFAGQVSQDAPYRVLFAIPDAQLREQTNRRRLEFLALTALVIGLTGLGTWMLVGKVLSPIGKLSTQAATASTDRLTVTLQTPSADTEMVGLVGTLNGLLSRLAQTSAAKGRFYAAASHELRTPLQALSGHLELALTRQRSADDYAKVITEAHRQTVRLITLVQDLLLLHQLDTNLPTAKEEIDLNMVCKGALDQLQPLLDLRGLKVNFQAGEASKVQSLNSHAEILVRNVVENAAKYADEGTTIDIRLEEAAKSLQLTVTNPYRDSSQIQTERLFEPFYRPDASRNSKTGGNGLGLAICQALASANGWFVRFVPEDGTVRVLVDFPKLLTESEITTKADKKRREKARVAGATHTPV